MSGSVATRGSGCAAQMEFASHSVIVMYLPLTAHDMSSVRLADIRKDISRRLSLVTCDMEGAARDELIESMSHLRYASERQIMRDALATLSDD